MLNVISGRANPVIIYDRLQQSKNCEAPQHACRCGEAKAQLDPPAGQLLFLRLRPHPRLRRPISLIMESINVPELVERLGSSQDAVRKMAAFKLQSNIGDPSFADVFSNEGGLKKLRYLVMSATGNTLAYSLSSFSKLLEVDKGWDYIDQDLVERV